MRYSFLHDCLDGAHPELLNYITSHNSGQQPTGDSDEYRELATKRLRKAFGLPNADIQFVPTGTMANIIGLGAMLRPHQGIIAAETGHINTYESGAIEAIGHKIIGIDAPDGKLTPNRIAQGLACCDNDYAIMPKVVYISQITELGTIYTRPEMEAIIQYAKSQDLYVFLDGARLASALASKASGMTLGDFGNLGLDMFFVGGTKNGGMYGEALVVLNEDLKAHLRSQIKRRGGLMAKPRFMELQFARFFAEDNLWLKLAENANKQAMCLHAGLKALGIGFDAETSTNLIFPILPSEILKPLGKEYGFASWQKVDATHTKVRLVCSWSTQTKDVEGFLQTVKTLLSVI